MKSFKDLVTENVPALSFTYITDNDTREKLAALWTGEGECQLYYKGNELNFADNDNDDDKLATVWEFMEKVDSTERPESQLRLRRTEGSGMYTGRLEVYANNTGVKVGELVIENDTVTFHCPMGSELKLNIEKRLYEMLHDIEDHLFVVDKSFNLGGFE